MLRSYPLTRCPACKKAFRQEIKDAAAPDRNLGQIVCPNCGLKFQRFEIPLAKGTVGHAALR